MSPLDIILFIYLGVCALTDLRRRRVYNVIVVPGLVLGIGMYTALHGWQGCVTALLGCASGCAMLLPFYLLGGIGAGDVKFLMAAGALAGPAVVLVGGLYGALIGGMVALVVVMRNQDVRIRITAILMTLLHRQMRQAHELLHAQQQPVTLPYVVFLSVGIMLRWVELWIRS